MAPSKLRWWHCLPISLMIHAMLAILCLHFLPDHFSSQRFETLFRPTDHVIVVHTTIPVYLPEDTAEEPPPAAATTDDPFAPAETPDIATPDIVIPAPQTVSPNIPLPAPQTSIPKNIVPTESLPSPPELPTQPLESPSTSPTQTAIAKDIAPSSAANPTKGISPTPIPGTPQNSDSKPTQTSTAKSAPSSPPQQEIDLWKNYTRQLSAHFKKRHHYPEMAKKMRLTGTVWVALELRRDGTLIAAHVKTSSGYPILDQAALTAAQKSVPVAPFPPQTTAQQKTILIPYHYKMP